jgi:quinolinate synthase
MTLQEAEIKLSELNEEINRLLAEREDVLKEWNDAFGKENPQNIICIDENVGDSHNLYLVNGESRKEVCLFCDRGFMGSLDDFYKVLDNSMGMLNIANKRDFELPDDQKNLVYAKAIEIRERMIP